MTDDIARSRSRSLRLPLDYIGQALPGDIIWHPQGFLVELVACYHEYGYYFWFRIEDDTLSREGKIEGGSWESTPPISVPGKGFSREINLLAKNQKRRDEIIDQVQKLHEEMALLIDINNVIYSNVLTKE